MKDGSKLLDKYEDSSYVKYSLDKNKLYINGNPLYDGKNEGGLDYALTDNLIKTSIYSGLLIEKITNDSLVVSEKIDGFSNEKLKRFYFVREEVLLSKIKKKNKDRKNIIASKLYTPKTKSKIEIELVNAFMLNNFSNFELIGNLKIYPKEKKVKSQITFSTHKDSTRIRILKKIFDNSFEKWNLGGFEEYESVELPFVLKMEYTHFFRGIKLLFFTNNLNDINKAYGTRLEDLKNSSVLFEKGIKAYQKKKYIKAVEFFSKSYEINPKNIDALYNKAAVYFEFGDIENACIVWNKISELGQVEGKKLYKNNCMQ